MDDNQKIAKIENSLKNLESAFKWTEEFRNNSKDFMGITATIKAFEYTYELSIKIMKEILDFYSVETIGSKDVIRQSANKNIIENPDKWFEFVNDRNLTVHTYNLDVAEDVFQNIADFIDEVKILVSKTSELIIKLKQIE